jgi:hypothetical protein
MIMVTQEEAAFLRIGYVADRAAVIEHAGILDPSVRKNIEILAGIRRNLVRIDLQHVIQIAVCNLSIDNFHVFSQTPELPEGSVIRLGSVHIILPFILAVSCLDVLPNLMQKDDSSVLLDPEDSTDLRDPHHMGRDREKALGWVDAKIHAVSYHHRHITV